MSGKTAKKNRPIAKAKKPAKAATKPEKPAVSGGPRCGLCGSTERLTKTECCDNWICDDEGEYVMFSFARNSCSRNHRRYTLCGSHFAEEHEGRWQDCAECREAFETEMYVYFGTNEYNFEILQNPPSYEPTLCARCKKVIRLGTDGFSMSREGYFCTRCGDAVFRERHGSPQKR